MFDTYETGRDVDGHSYHVTFIPPTMIDMTSERSIICWIDGYVAYSGSLDDWKTTMGDIERDFFSRVPD